MKKNILFFTMLLLLAVVSATAVSCGDDNKGDEPKGETFSTFSNTFTFSNVSADLVELADISIEYTDFTGATHTKTISQGDNEITFSTKKLPVSSKFKIILTRKANVELTKDKYDITMTCGLDAEAKDKNGGKQYWQNFGYVSVKTLGVKKDKLDDAFSRIERSINNANGTYNHQYYLDSSNSIAYK